MAIKNKVLVPGDNNRHKARRTRGRSRSTRKVRGVYTPLIPQMNALLKKYNHLDATGSKIIGHETRRKRAEHIEQALRQLFGAGYKFKDIRSLKCRHLTFLFDDWLDKKLAAKTLANKLSSLQALCNWIDKPGLLKCAQEIYTRKGELNASKSCSQIAKKDKSYNAANIDVPALISKIEQAHPIVAVQIELQFAFGLRVNESMLMLPHIADQGSTLNVVWGTKGNRPRFGIPIETDYQRDVLKKAKRLARGIDATMIPEEKTHKQWRSHYYYVVRKFGLSRKALGFTSHGFRHGYVHKRFNDLTGHPVPVVKPLGALDPKEKFEAAKARYTVSEELGHSRPTVTDAYAGALSRAVRGAEVPQD